MEGVVDFFLKISVQACKFRSNQVVNFLDGCFDSALRVISHFGFSAAFSSGSGSSSEAAAGDYINFYGFFSTVVENFSGNEVFDDG